MMVTRELRRPLEERRGGREKEEEKAIRRIMKGHQVAIGWLPLTSNNGNLPHGAMGS